jgi:transcription antitermination factor NusG
MPGWHHIEATHRWFAVQVRAGREHVSAEHLRLRGYEVFLPCYRERRRWSDRTKLIVRALFAGYVFCRIVECVEARIVTAPGVIRILGDGSGPVPVPEHEIESIKRVIETQLSVEPWPMPQAGQKVRFETGPLRGLEGIVLMAKDRNRLIVSVSLLRRAVAVQIDSRWISWAPLAPRITAIPESLC